MCGKPCPPLRDPFSCLGVSPCQLQDFATSPLLVRVLAGWPQTAWPCLFVLGGRGRARSVRPAPWGSARSALAVAQKFGRSGISGVFAAHLPVSLDSSLHTCPTLCPALPLALPWPLPCPALPQLAVRMDTADIRRLAAKHGSRLLEGSVVKPFRAAAAGGGRLGSGGGESAEGAAPARKRGRPRKAGAAAASQPLAHWSDEVLAHRL